MHGASPLKLAIAALTLIGAVTAFLAWTGGIYADRYEGDMLHLADIVARMAEGQRPHLDFMTPLGVLSVWPIAVFLEAGAGFGHAVFYGQAIVALAIAPLAVWVAASRFSGLLAYGYLALVLFFVLGLVSGGSEASISLSMHYNRWAWALAFVAVPVALLPALRRNVLADGLAMGLPLAALVLIKATYVVALVPGIVILLVARRAWRALGIGVAAGTAALAAFTLVVGFEFWLAYIDDLLTTASSETRARPGLPFAELLTAPAFLAGHIAALVGVVLMRRSEDPAIGMGLLFLFPGFVFITYQNFGNDPQWMLLLGLMLAQARPAAPVLRQPVVVTAVALLAFALPSFLNISLSPLRNNAVEAEEYAALIPGREGFGDFFTPAIIRSEISERVAAEDRFAAVLDDSAVRDSDKEEADGPETVAGRVLPSCEPAAYLALSQRAIAQDLIKRGYGDARILIADLLSSVWLFTPDMPPLIGAAPWHYSGLPGIEDAEFILIPTCPVALRSRASMVDALQSDGRTLEIIIEHDLYLLAQPGAGSGTADEDQTLARDDQASAQIMR